MLKEEDRLTKKAIRGIGYRSLDQFKYVVARLGLYEDTGLTAIEARELAEKATAKTPVYEGEIARDGSVEYTSWACPSCECRYLLQERYRYCPKCGQKIDSGGHK